MKKISEKLKDFYKRDFLTFITELKKQKAKLTKKDEMNLLPLFNEKKSELDSLSIRINQLEGELDERVFELYGITEEERGFICK